MTEYICSECLNIGAPKRVKRGSSKLDFMCWMIFPIGLPYTLWRMLSKYDGCKQCGNADLVDMETPYGKTLLKRFDRTISGAAYNFTPDKF